MANLWVRTPSGYTSQAITTLGGTEDDRAVFERGGLLVVPYRDGARSRHVLIDRSRSLLVNGTLVTEGIRVLRHKDELQAGSQRMYFSTESLPVVETFELDEYATADNGSSTPRRRPRCPICRGTIQDGEKVVRCPGCQRVFHQMTVDEDGVEKPCWTYAPDCRFCSHPTSLTGQDAWRPDNDPACAD